VRDQQHPAVGAFAEEAFDLVVLGDLAFLNVDKYHGVDLQRLQRDLLQDDCGQPVLGASGVCLVVGGTHGAGLHFDVSLELVLFERGEGLAVEGSHGADAQALFADLEEAGLVLLTGLERHEGFVPVQTRGVSRDALAVAHRQR